jgi:hypothetical protein
MLDRMNRITKIVGFAEGNLVILFILSKIFSSNSSSADNYHRSVAAEIIAKYFSTGT